MKRFLSLAGFVCLVFLIGWAGHELTFASVRDWYVTLKKPVWTPPSWVFGPTWTVLYFMIAVSGWLVWIKAKPSSMRRFSFFVYGAQLAANLSWSYFFFFLRSPLMGLFDIIILMILIGFNTYLFFRLYRPAGILLIPYFFWTLFASVLNWAIWELNH